MPITISGSTGIAGVDGSAGIPAVQGTDTNTGIVFPAADTVAVATGGTERMRIDSTGNVGIGTSSPASYAGYSTLTINNTTGAVIDLNVAGTRAGTFTMNASGAIFGTITNTPLGFWANSAERMRIDSSGNVGIGTSSPAGALSVYRATGTAQWAIQALNNVNTGGSGFWQRTNGQHEMVLRDTSNNANFITNSSNNLEFVVNGSERARIDASGNVGIGTSSPTNKLSVNGSMNASNYYMQDSSAAAAGTYGFANSNGPFIQTWGNSSAQAGALVIATSGSERMRITSGGTLLVGTTTQLNGITLKHSDGATTYRPSNNAGFGVHHFNSDVGGTAALKSYVQCDGTYTNLSDQRFKTDIAPARSYLGDLLKIQVVNYKWKDDADNEKKLGVIAQQVEQVFPSMVKNVVGNSQTGETQKMVPHEVFVPMLITAIQELKAENDDLKARLTALEAK